MSNKLVFIDGLFLSIIFVIICVMQAGYQANKFINHKTINHFRHGMYYVIVCGAASAWFIRDFGLALAIKIFLLSIIVRAAFFDPILNLMREKPIWYNGSYNTGKNDGSLLDLLEHKIIRLHKRWLSEQPVNELLIALKITYVAVWLVYIIFII